MPPLETSENKAPRKKRKLWLIPVVFLAVLTVIYFGGVLLFHFIFLPHTTIYGTDYSLNLTLQTIRVISPAMELTLTLKPLISILPTMVKGTLKAPNHRRIYGHGPWKSLSLVT